MRIVICGLPWPRIENVIIQIATLKAFLRKKGITAIGRYYYKDLPHYLGVEVIDKIVRYELQQYETAALLFPSKKVNIEYFFKKFIPDLNFSILLHKLKKYYTDIVNDILAINPDAVGFTVSFFQLIPSLYVSKLLKKRRKGIKIILGGAYLDENFSFHILQLFPYIDYVIIGEGEQTLYELCKAIDKRNFAILSKIRGIVFRDQQNKIVINRRRELIKNLNSLPIPDFSDYFTHSLANKPPPYPKIVLEGSRGCFYGKCSFCNLNYQWKNCYRFKSDERVLNEILHCVKKYKVLSFLFCDTNMSNRKSLFEKLSRLNYDLEIYAEISGHGVNRDFFRILKRAGVREIQIGIEALSDHLLRILNKGVDVMRNVEMLKWCSEFEISVFYNLIYGIPGEKKEDIEETLENMQYVKYFQPPARLCNFMLSYNSFAFLHPTSFNIKNFRIPVEYFRAYPKKLVNSLGPLLSPIVGYDLEDQTYLNLWKRVYKEIESWRKNYERNNKKPGIFYQKGEGYIIITLLQEGREKRIRIDDELAAQLYIECSFERKSLSTLSKKFKVEEDSIQNMLDALVRKKLMFKCDKEYFSLGIPIKNYE